MRREDVERLAVAQVVAALLARGNSPEFALEVAGRVWSQIADLSGYGLANEADTRAEYVHLLANHYAIGLTRGLAPTEALEFAREATGVLMKEIDPDYVGDRL
jgi:hypothetical protein